MKHKILMFALTLAVSQAIGQENISLNKQEKEGLQFMREEEKLARDVYDSMYAKWEVNPFGNIRYSERVHMNRMKGLLDQFKLEDPVGLSNDQPGEFRNPEMKKIYRDLVQSGSLSLSDALKAGAKIEELDIADLDIRISQTKNEDVLIAYRFLRMGSENHLRAFVRRLKAQGISYQPEHLSQQEFDRIIGGDNGNGCCQGRKGGGNGNCKGNGDGRNGGNRNF